MYKVVNYQQAKLYIQKYIKANYEKANYIYTTQEICSISM